MASLRRSAVRLLLLAGCCCALAGAPRLGGQGLDKLRMEDRSRREYLTPGLVLETGARTAACDVLLFTRDGKHLLAAGDDKVVRTWDVTAAGLAPSKTFPILRWPVFREVRGNIYALALSPDESMAAIGGFARESHGFAAAVLDRKTGAIRHGLAPRDARHQGSIWAIAFSPSGKKVALGTDRGDVWLWDLVRDRLDSVGTHAVAQLTPEQAEFKKVRLVAFDGEDRVVSVGGNGDMVRWGPGGQGTVVHRFSGFIATPVVLSPDGKWIAGIPEATAGKTQRTVEVVSFPDARAAKGPFAFEITRDIAGFGRVQAIPHRAAFNARSDLLAVALRVVGDPERVNFFQERGGFVQVFDLKQGGPPRSGPEQGLYAEAVAFDPTDDSRLAVAGGDNHEVSLWKLGAKPTPLGSAVRSPGSCLWGVAVDPKARYVAFQEQRDHDPPHPNQRGAGPWRYFDLQTRRFVTGKAPFTPARNSAAAQGWRVVTAPEGIDPKTGQRVVLRDKARADRWHVEETATGRQFPIPLDRTLDEFPRCWTFLPAVKGEPPRLAVGHYWGVSIFDLTAQGPVRSRLLRGHEGYVTALAVSADGKRLVSALRDQTIAGWGLEGWPSHAALGAVFFGQQGKLRVGTVDPGSPVWETGLEQGDEIYWLKVNNVLVFNRLDALGKPFGSLDDALAALRTPRPGIELAFIWKRPGDDTLYRQLTTIADRPLWRFFPTRADRGADWVLWRWRDYFYDSSTNGDFSIGWQRSYGITEKKPDFYRAEQFRKQFLWPDKVADTLRRWQQGSELYRFNQMEPPEVKIEPVGDADRVARDAPVKLRIRVKPRGPLENQMPDRLLVWVNDYQHRVVRWKAEDWQDAQKLPAKDKVYDAVLEVPASEFRVGENLVTAQCYSRAGLRDEAAPVAIRSERPAGERNLYGLIVGVGDYRASKPRQADLKASLDAAVLHQAWAAQKGKAFKTADVKLLADNDVTPAAVLKALQQLEKQVGPDDILVFHLGGHGVRLEELRAFKKKDGSRLLPEEKLKGLSPFLFCCGDFGLDRLNDTTIGFEDLYQRLVKIRCHKLILLDACHSGQQAQAAVDTDANPVRILTREGVGPVILAACRPDQSALENAIVDNAVAFGLFTIALRRILEEDDSFQEADRNKDGVLEATELAGGVRAAVKDLVEELRSRKLQGVTDQDPIDFLPRLEERLWLLRKQ